MFTNKDILKMLGGLVVIGVVIGAVIVLGPVVVGWFLMK